MPQTRLFPPLRRRLAAALLASAAASAWPQAGDPGKCLVLDEGLTREQILRPFIEELVYFRIFSAAPSARYRAGNGNTPDSGTNGVLAHYISDVFPDRVRLDLYSRMGGVLALSTIREYRMAGGLPVELRMGDPGADLGPGGTYAYQSYEYSASGPSAGAVSMFHFARVVGGVHTDPVQWSISYRPDGRPEQMVGTRRGPGAVGPETGIGRTTWAATEDGEREVQWVWDTLGGAWRAQRQADYHFNAGGLLVSRRTADIDERTGRFAWMTREDMGYDAQGRLESRTVYEGGNGSLDTTRIQGRMRYQYDYAGGEATASQVRERDRVEGDTAGRPSQWWTYRYDRDCRRIEKKAFSASATPQLRNWEVMEWDAPPLGSRRRISASGRPAHARVALRDALGRLPPAWSKSSVLFRTGSPAVP